MNKLLTTLAATVFVATTAFGMAAEVASTPVKVQTHSVKTTATKHADKKASAASSVHKIHAKKHTSAASAASTVQKAQAKKHASAASSASAVHKAPAKKHASAASAA